MWVWLSFWNLSLFLNVIWGTELCIKQETVRMWLWRKIFLQVLYLGSKNYLRNLAGFINIFKFTSTQFQNIGWNDYPRDLDDFNDFASKAFLDVAKLELNSPKATRNQGHMRNSGFTITVNYCKFLTLEARTSSTRGNDWRRNQWLTNQV